jgi:hypothetical protein
LINQFTINKISVFSILLSHAVAEAALCFGAGFESLYVDGNLALVTVEVVRAESSEVLIVGTASVFCAGLVEVEQLDLWLFFIG